MPYIIRDTSSTFKPAPSGLHVAVCCDVVDAGMMTGTWGPKKKVRLAWQIEERDPETGKRYLASQLYTESLHKKSNLRRDLESWRGRSFTEDELKGFDMEKVIGIPCQLQIIHNSRDGQTYANVSGIVPLGRGMVSFPAEDYVRVKDREGQPAPPEPGSDDDDAIPF